MRTTTLAAAALVAALLMPALLEAGAARDAPAWGRADAAPIRPGSSLGGSCTLGFLFTDASGDAFVGAAAHCTRGAGQRVATPGVGEFGSVVFDSDHAAGANRSLDFALVRIDADKVGLANPAVRFWGGPSGVAAPDALRPAAPLAFHGHALVLGATDATRPRAGALAWTTSTHFGAALPAAWGDSGAPVLDLASGEAVGMASRLRADGLPPSTVVGPLVPWILDELRRAGFDVALAAAPRAT